MTQAMEIEVKRSGFPVTIGGVSLWFDTSDERLAQFYDIEAEAQKRLTAFEKEIVSFSDEKETGQEETTKETVLGAIELENKLLEIQYDLLFGDGTFATLYQEFPDHRALNSALEQAANLIEQKLTALAVEREKVSKERIEQYTQKSKVARQKK